MSRQIKRLDNWDQAKLKSIGDKYGTPVYVINLDRVKENYQRINEAFTHTKVSYAAKANTQWVVLNALEEAGAAVECASAGEIIRAIDANFTPEQVHYTAVNPPSDDLDIFEKCVKNGGEGITISVGANDTIDRLAKRDHYQGICIRVNPDIGAGHHEKVTTGTDAKFGIPYDEVLETIDETVERGFDVVGIHAHLGSGISNDDHSTYREFLKLMSELAHKSPVDLEFIDIGGGFGVPYHPSEDPLDLEALSNITRETLSDLDCEIIIEPGRYIVADAGVLLTRVNTVKETEPTIVGVDAGMNTLLRPALYDAFHDIQNISDKNKVQIKDNVKITGPICESADVLGEGRSLSKPELGDILGIGNAGAYGIEMANQYNSRPKPAAVAIQDNNTILAQEREKIDDLTRLERELDL